jgi:hypothetical protein
MMESNSLKGTDHWTEKIQVWLNAEQFNVSGLNELMDFLTGQEELMPELEKSVLSYLQSIRWESFASYLMEKIPNCQSPGIRALLLRAGWENGADFSNHLEALVKILLFATFEESLEASSLIESIDPQMLNEEDKERAINIILENLSKLDQQRKEYATMMIEILQP